MYRSSSQTNITLFKHSPWLVVRHAGRKPECRQQVNRANGTPASCLRASLRAGRFTVITWPGMTGTYFIENILLDECIGHRHKRISLYSSTLPGL